MSRRDLYNENPYYGKERELFWPDDLDTLLGLVMKKYQSSRIPTAMISQGNTSVSLMENLTVNPSCCLGPKGLWKTGILTVRYSRSAPDLYTVINGVSGVWRFESSREYNEPTG